MKHKVRNFMVTQQVKYMKEEDILNGIKAPAIKDWGYRLHDKDIDINGEPEAPHWHIIIRLKNPSELKHVAKWFGVEMQYVEYQKKSWGAMCRYLVHKNDAGKYPYSIEGIKANFNIEAEINKESNEKSRKEEIRNSVQEGIWKRHNLRDHITGEEYHKYKDLINSAFEYWEMKLAKMEKNMKVLFITGESETGKTAYAQHLAKAMELDYYITSDTKHPFDEYGGQEIVILDELRPDSFGVADLLKLTDNNTASAVGARWKNKHINGVKYMIITSVLDVTDFYMDSVKGTYKKTKKESSEISFKEQQLAKQLLRRVEKVFYMSEEEITYFKYIGEENKLVKISTFPNIVKYLYKQGKKKAVFEPDKMIVAMEKLTEEAKRLLKQSEEDKKLLKEKREERKDNG